MMNKFSLPILSMFASCAIAAPSPSQTAKIFYSADMEVPTVSELIKTIDDINSKDEISNIYLYINSYGGDMDSGLMASAAIRSSKKPVTTIAMSTIGSSATIMLCAAKDRRALPEGSIYLHPSYTHYEGDVRPNTIKELNQELTRFNDMFRKTYQSCTNLSHERIENILFSESNRVTFTPDEALKIELISKIDQNIIDTPHAFYITAPH
ncbi:ATP-dependent Clp protease proteolytic subunit [Aeromonas veronii]|uniref:ATP-dependent Clp protease proteolytic subunit n=1 Tax=Aeromonas jandaei TaxID=650 RepID=UPI0038D74794